MVRTWCNACVNGEDAPGVPHPSCLRHARSASTVTTSLITVGPAQPVASARALTSVAPYVTIARGVVRTATGALRAIDGVGVAADATGALLRACSEVLERQALYHLPRARVLFGTSPPDSAVDPAGLLGERWWVECNETSDRGLGRRAWIPLAWCQLQDARSHLLDSGRPVDSTGAAVGYSTADALSRGWTESIERTALPRLLRGRSWVEGIIRLTPLAAKCLTGMARAGSHLVVTAANVENHTVAAVIALNSEGGRAVGGAAGRREPEAALERAAAECYAKAMACDMTDSIRGSQVRLGASSISVEELDSVLPDVPLADWMSKIGRDGAVSCRWMANPLTTERTWCAVNRTTATIAEYGLAAMQVVSTAGGDGQTWGSDQTTARTLFA